MTATETKNKGYFKAEEINFYSGSHIFSAQKLTACQAVDFWLTHPNVVQDSLKLQWLILPLHCSGVQAITTINELDDVACWTAYCEVILWAQILQRLHQTPLLKYRETTQNNNDTDTCDGTANCINTALWVCNHSPRKWIRNPN